MKRSKKQRRRPPVAPGLTYEQTVDLLEKITGSRVEVLVGTPSSDVPLVGACGTFQRASSIPFDHVRRKLDGRTASLFVVASTATNGAAVDPSWILIERAAFKRGDVNVEDDGYSVISVQSGGMQFTVSRPVSSVGSE